MKLKLSKVYCLKTIGSHLKITFRFKTSLFWPYFVAFLGKRSPSYYLQKAPRMAKKNFILNSKNNFEMASKKAVNLRWVSLSRPAPAESPRLGTEQGYAVERCDGSSLPFFYSLNFYFYYLGVPARHSSKKK
jgi:hypothetical protein